MIDDTNVNKYKITIVKPQEPKQSWSTNEIQQLINYVNEVREDNSNLRAHLMLTEQKLKNEESKVRVIQQQLNLLLYENRTKNQSTK
jgi:hypothetical protein